MILKKVKKGAHRVLKIVGMFLPGTAMTFVAPMVAAYELAAVSPTIVLQLEH
jgi:hypothetical protein